MSVGVPPERYDRNWFNRAFDRLTLDVRSRYSKQQDVLISGTRLVLTSPDGSLYAVTVANDGTLSTTAL